MNSTITDPSTVRFDLSTTRVVEVKIYGIEARIMAWGIDHEGRRIPTSLMESEIEGFVNETKRMLKGPLDDEVKG